jgi:two-component system CheB/CheR fusion protein
VKPEPASISPGAQPAPVRAADALPATEPQHSEAASSPGARRRAPGGESGAPADAPAQPEHQAQLPPAPAAPETPATESSTGIVFPIVGIGASAGGLAAFEALFAHMPPDSDTGIAFVLVQHLDPGHKSMLSELVRRYTRMRVFEVADGMSVEPNCVYIIQPNKDMVLLQGKLHLMDPSALRGLRLPIDFFFRSLAQDRGDQAIGIILSGNGTDGTLGLRAIKEAGGMAMVQDSQSAEYEGMPRSAIAAGLADFVLPPSEMPAQLIRYVKRIGPLRPSPAVATPPEVSDGVLKILALVRSHTGHDFSNYKLNTIRRRIERRMVVNQIERLDDYVRLLRQNPAELDTLFRELLIGVTNFFRDPAAFDALRDLALAPLLAEKPPGLPLRVWVPGCSTGEEAYSLVMLLMETGEKLGREFVTQVFATDIDHDSIEKARAALYPASITADVSPERLTRFFTHEDKDFYRVRKHLRDQLVFAEQDVVKDPPFSRVDLISCRNLLIYTDTVLQRRLLPMLHYALCPGGFLLLGSSETVGEFTNLFVPVDRKWKLYRRKELGHEDRRGFGTAGAPAARRPPGALPREGRAVLGERRERRPSLRELTERLLLRSYAPACVAVNEQGEILYVHGRSGKYLELPPGEASLNLVRASREGLKIELASALRQVALERRAISYQGLEVRTNGGFQTVNLTIEPAEKGPGASNIFIVTFQDGPRKSAAAPAPPPAPEAGAPSEAADEKDRHIAALERELRLKSETLQSTIEELEASNEELQSTNEELQSSNEEFETSKEELQSVNEELVTVNTELQQKMEGLSRANSDMNNLLAGTGIGMLFVDHQLRIQRFTPPTTQVINLIQTDVGRPVSDLVPNLMAMTAWTKTSSPCSTT